VSAPYHNPSSAPAVPAWGALREPPARLLASATDERLALLAAAGSEGAFGALYERHHRAMLGFCRRLLGSVEQAEDVVQHTVAAAYLAIGRGDRLDAVQGWLFTVARNKCVSLLRRKLDCRPLDERDVGSGLSVADMVAQRLELGLIIQELEAMPHAQRAALVLAAMEGRSCDEIAATLGVRRDAVRTLVFYARKRLRRSREARDADCTRIQEQLAVLRGGSLLRAPVRRHLAQCTACEVYLARVKERRAASAAVATPAPGA
jgi:RNA polymerase sigma factor (sigma-70 family)